MQYNLIELPENAAVVDLGCRDAGFLLGLTELFPGKIRTALGVDRSEQGVKNIPTANRYS